MKRSVICTVLSVVAVAGLSFTFKTVAFGAGESALIQVESSAVTEEIFPVDVRRALFVFVRFRDDTGVDEGCTDRAVHWREPDLLPGFSDHLLARDSAPPFDPRSLTDYFYQQSNGRLILYGSVYPEVIVTAGDEADYGTSGVNVARLTPELLDVINTDARINLSDYDENEDGIVDHIIFVLRRVTGWSGPQYRHAAGLNFVGYNSTTPEFGSDPNRLKKVVASMSGSYVRYNNPGNIFPDLNLVRLVAHEYGHNVWGGDHVRAIGGPNGVPANDSDHVGYLLMAGTGDQRGSLTVSAAERDLLGKGWIRCTTLHRDTVAAVTDLYTTDDSNCFKIAFDESDGVSGWLYISNRQRIGHFEKLRSESCYGDRSDHGLMTTGLLVTRVDPAGKVATIVADNTLKSSVLSEAYTGDMFRAKSNAQLTPWTRPNIYGMSGYPPGFELSESGFQAIDNFRHDPADSLVVVFDYVTDFRRGPTFRQDATIGPESSGISIRGPATFLSESTLRMTADVIIHGAAIVEAGAVLRVERGAVVTIDTLRLAGGSILEVYGTLHVKDVFEYDGAKIVKSDDGILDTPVGVGTEPVLDPLRGGTLDVYPNPVKGELTIRFTIPAGEPGQIEVFNVLGQRVAVLASRGQGPERGSVVWDTSTIAAGLYYVTVQSSGAPLVRSVVKVD